MRDSAGTAHVFVGTVWAFVGTAAPLLRMIVGAARAIVGAPWLCVGLCTGSAGGPMLPRAPLGLFVGVAELSDGTGRPG